MINASLPRTSLRSADWNAELLDASSTDSFSRNLAATDDSAYIGFHDTVAMPSARSDHTVTLMSLNLYSSIDLLGARFYIIAGCNGDQTCLFNQQCITRSGTDCTICSCSSITANSIYFNPEVSKYTEIAAAPSPRYRHQAAAVGSKLYVFGGRDLADTLIQTIDILETTTNTWTSVTVGSGAALNLVANDVVSDGVAFSFGSSLFLVGGFDFQYNSISKLSKIDTSTATWGYSTVLAAMPTGRGDITVQFYKNEFYVLGGWNPSFTEAVNTVESYSVATNTWTVRPHMIHKRGDLAVGVISNSLFAIAGEQRNKTKDPTGDVLLSFPVSLVTKYTAASNAWSEEASIPVNRFRFVGGGYNSSSSYLSSAVYLFGGQDDYDATCKCFRVLKTTLKYIPASTYTKQYKKTLDAGEIAGIAIGAIITACAILVSIVAYVLYRRRGYFLKQDVQLSNMSVQRLDSDENNPQEVSRI